MSERLQELAKDYVEKTEALRRIRHEARELQVKDERAEAEREKVTDELCKTVGSNRPLRVLQVSETQCVVIRHAGTTGVVVELHDLE